MKLKKLTAMITILGLSALALSACGGATQTTNTQAAAPAETAAVESTVESAQAAESTVE